MSGFTIPFSRRRLLACATVLMAPNGMAAAGEIVDAAGHMAKSSHPKRIVSIGSAATEILVELGFADRIVAIDTTSRGVLPEGQAPDIGYMRALAAEGILAQTPDLIVATLDSGPKEVIDSLRASGIPLALLPVEPTVDGILSKINLLGTLLDVRTKADDLAKRVRAQAQDLTTRAATTSSKPKALFVLGTATDRFTVGGAGTAADSVLQMAGAYNIAHGISGYKQLSPEIVAADPPDVIVLMVTDPRQASPESILTNPALAATPASQNRSVILVDGAALLSFGTRTLVQAGKLADALHPKT
ncbi:heme/hemin ABC transporter substrate-binding protein [Aestuariivirga sp.]|uniref:heme/hemin ABC transporter substrate-binding protein n=1 Tax=Aestuariivirga sp. TaxID=2650926 RepID=UPI0039E3C7DA